MQNGVQKGWGCLSSISFGTLIRGKTLQRRRLDRNLVTMVEQK
jgi:hypothetical protein